MSGKRQITTAAIELATGFSSELLRKWRKRYGFPMSVGEGESAYSQGQLDQLSLIRRLLDNGYRPAQVVGKSLKELADLADPRRTDQPPPSPFSREAIVRLKRYDLAGLRQLLIEARQASDLAGFIDEVVVPLTQALGHAWAIKELDVHHEHLCTAVLVSMLSAELQRYVGVSGQPVLVLGTPMQEQHVLGLLMAECVLSQAGAACVNLGAQVPAHDLAMAAIGCRASILAVSFSFSYPRHLVRPWLVQMRKMLPPDIEIWAGGAGTAAIRRQLAGVRIFSDLQSARVALVQRPGQGVGA